MANKRKCRQCGKYSKPEDMRLVPLGAFCDDDCATKYAYANRAKGHKKKQRIERKELREAKERVKTRQEWIRDAQRWFNKFVRLRDADEPCISCGRYHEGQYHAGHYRTTGAAGHLRFNEDNCHKQCSACNNHLSGNIEHYRPRLIEKIGIKRVEALESNNEKHQWTIDELKEIKAKYKTKCKELEQ